MHPLPHAFTIGRTVLKESDDLVILGVTFDSKITFEKHLRSVSRAASQRLAELCLAPLQVARATSAATFSGAPGLAPLLFKIDSAAPLVF